MIFKTAQKVGILPACIYTEHKNSISFNKCPLQLKKTIIKLLLSSTNLAFSFGMELRTFSNSTLVLLSSMRKIIVSVVQVVVAFASIC